jgi:hypothetical protein
MKCFNSGVRYISSYTLTSQLLTIPNLSRSTTKSKTESESKTESRSNFFQSFNNYLKGISLSKSNF